MKLSVGKAKVLIQNIFMHQFAYLVCTSHVFDIKIKSKSKSILQSWKTHSTHFNNQSLINVQQVIMVHES